MIFVLNLNSNFSLFYYCISFVATGSVVPFMPVLARQLGFSTFVVGSVYSILPILGLIAKPLFGAIADRYVYLYECFVYILPHIVSLCCVPFISK